MKNKPPKNITSLILRLGLAFVFTYAALFVSINASTGEHYVPVFVGQIIPIQTFLSLFTIYEILLSVWLLSGKFVKYAGLIAALTIFSITAFNIADFHTLFRNVCIFATAVALMTLP